MMNTVMIELQAAVMAASAVSSNAASDIPEGGESFSDVLAAQKELAVENGAVEEAVENGDAEADMTEEMNEEFSEVMKAIEKADDGVKDALMRLLETMLKAFRGSDDDRERRTDIFMLFSDGSAGLGENSRDDMLLSAELLCRTGVMLEHELEEGGETDEIITKIEDMIIKVLGKDNEENVTSAAEILAAMMDTSVNQLEFAEADEIRNVAEILTAAKKSLPPEYAERAEILFMEYKSMGNDGSDAKGMAEMMKLNFNTVKINNASRQVESIGRANADEIPEDAEAAVAESIADVAAVMQNAGADTAAGEVKALDADTADSVEIQIHEFVREKLMDIKSDSGTSEMTMILKPENLGEVAVKLIKENGAVTVMISAQYEEVGKLMSERAAALGVNLQNQNFNVKDVQIVAAGNAAEQMGLDFTNQGFGFMHNGANQRQGSSYHGAEAVKSVEDSEPVTELKLKEAKLWATA